MIPVYLIAFGMVVATGEPRAVGDEMPDWNTCYAHAEILERTGHPAQCGTASQVDAIAKAAGFDNGHVQTLKDGSQVYVYLPR